MWHEINKDEDITEFLEKTGELHDSVIVSVSYDSGCSGTDTGLICFPPSDEHTLRLVVDSEWTGRIEIYFTGVRYFSFFGYSDTYVKNIFGCELEFRTDLLGKTRDDRLILWNDGGIPDIRKLRIDLKGDNPSFIISEHMKWRFIED